MVRSAAIRRRQAGHGGCLFFIEGRPQGNFHLMANGSLREGKGRHGRLYPIAAEGKDIKKSSKKPRKA